MKKWITVVFAFAAISANAQNIQQDLNYFNRIIASPRVHLVLAKSKKESIRIEYQNVSKSKINVEVRGKTLSIFLDNARKLEKLEDRDSRRSRWMYEGVTVTAYVTYTELEVLEIRGNQSITCNTPIETEEFRLRAYGENEITLASLKTEFFKAAMYGENKLKIENGKVIEQKYKLYGENKIDTRDMKSAFTSTSIFGEGDLKVTSTEHVRVDAFGEPTIYVNGGADVNKRLVFGKAYIRKY